MMELLPVRALGHPDGPIDGPAPVDCTYGFYNQLYRVPPTCYNVAVCHPTPRCCRHPDLGVRCCWVGARERIYYVIIIISPRTARRWGARTMARTALTKSKDARVLPTNHERGLSHHESTCPLLGSFPLQPSRRHVPEGKSALSCCVYMLYVFDNKMKDCKHCH